jgi:hypothetical protein
MGRAWARKGARVHDLARLALAPSNISAPRTFSAIVGDTRLQLAVGNLNFESTIGRYEGGPNGDHQSTQANEYFTRDG